MSTRSINHLAQGLDRLPQAISIQGADIQRQKAFDPLPEYAVDPNKSLVLSGFTALERSWIFYPPVDRHGSPRPDGATLIPSVVTDRHNQVEIRSPRNREFIPTLASEPACGMALLGQDLKSHGVRRACRVTPRAVCDVTTRTQIGESRFGHDAAG